MHPRVLWPAGDVCWRCRLLLSSQRRAIHQIAFSRDATIPRGVSRLLQRPIHTTKPHVKSTLSTSKPSPADAALLHAPIDPNLPIRKQLRQWQDLYGGPSEDTLRAFENYPRHGDIQNVLSKLNHVAKADDDGYDEVLQGEDTPDGQELVTIGLFLKPGDVVELSQPGREPVLAVFVQQLNLKSQFFSVNGRWCHSLLNTISFAIPGCIDPDLLKPLVPFLPTNPDEASVKVEVQVPRELGAPIQRILGLLTEDSERIYRQNAALLDSAYSVLADPSRARMMTLAQITKTLLAHGDSTWKPSPAALLAARKALNHNEFRFRSDARSQRLTNVFAIRPKNDVQVVETVHEWIREFNEHQALCVNKASREEHRPSTGARFVAAFIEKARRLVTNSRQYREPRRSFVGPSKQRYSISKDSSAMRIVWREDFTTTDRQIINFLQAWVLSQQFQGMSSLHSACATILQATQCYEGRAIVGGGLESLGRPVGYLFLQEIGVLGPHENRLLYDEHLMLPTVRLSRNVELLNNKAELTRRNPDFRDSMAEFRRDWGSTNIYCIDDHGAKEIDDGISIEKIEGKDSEYWIHVHVANPTAFFDKTHVLSGLAAHMTETVYVPERVFPMLPVWATQNYFGLAPNRPAITFSSRVDLASNILETKIQHGIVRKVINITPSELAAALGEQPQEKVTRLIVGGEVPAASEPRKSRGLSPDQLRELQDLLSVARSLADGRKEAGAIRFDREDLLVRVFETDNQVGLAYAGLSLERSRFIHGDPVIEVTGKTTFVDNRERIDATNIVEEMMILACRSAASWCAERSIPVIFRGTVEKPSSFESPDQFMREVVQPYIEQHGGLSMGLKYKYRDVVGRAIAHISPLEHKMLGVPSYLKVTSPLRRFSDMISHWQIEAAVRYEAQTKTKLTAQAIADARRPILPFSQRQIQESIITLSPKEKIISNLKRQSSLFWTVQAFMRAFYDKETVLPDTFRVWIRWVSPKMRNSSRGTTGFISDMPIKVDLIDVPGVEYRMGDEWEAKIQSVNVFSNSITMEPVRLLRHEEAI